LPGIQNPAEQRYHSATRIIRLGTLLPFGQVEWSGSIKIVLINYFFNAERCASGTSSIGQPAALQRADVRHNRQRFLNGTFAP